MKKYKNLTNEQMGVSKKRFKKLLEYSYINNEDDLLLDEADDDSQEDVEGEPMQQDMDNQEIDDGEMEQEVDGDTMNQEIGGDEMDQGVDSGADDMMGNTMDDTMDDTMGDTLGEVESDGAMDEVEIDVTDLTAKQGDIDDKVTALSQQTETLLNTLIQLTNRIEKMSEKGDADNELLRKEIERRNPTPVEKLQRRIVISDPFNETPADYWRKKEAEGDYKLVDDDNEEEEYTITPSDLGGSANEIYKSLGFTDDEFNQSLESMFRI